MIFYEITLKSLPEIQFACTAHTEHYRNSFHKIKDFLELCLIEEGEIVCVYADKTEKRVRPGMFNPILETDDCGTFAYNGMPQTHTTVGVIAEYDAVCHDTARGVELRELEKRLNNGNCFLIPLETEPLMDFSALLARLKRLCTVFSSAKAYKNTKALSEWFSFVSGLTKIVMKELTSNSAHTPTEIRYVELAKEYIVENYKRAFYVGEIAESLGLSEGYLQTVFKGVTGISIMDFSNRYRINMAMQYAASGSLSLKDTAAQVGIDDPLYMSRMFKKIIGMSWREFCKNEKR